MRETPEFKKMQTEDKKFFEYLSQNAGEEFDPLDLWKIFDALYIEVSWFSYQKVIKKLKFRFRTFINDNFRIGLIGLGMISRYLNTLMTPMLKLSDGLMDWVRFWKAG